MRLLLLFLLTSCCCIADEQSCKCEKGDNGGECGICLKIVDSCPANPNLSTQCFASSVSLNGLCEGEGECGTSPEANNCGTFDVYERVSCDIPSNDICRDAIPVTQYKIGSTENARVESTLGFCGTSHTAPSVWYKVTGTGFTMTADTCDMYTNFDTKLSVYQGTCSSLACIGGNNNSCGTKSSYSWRSVSGANYFIAVHGGSSISSGDFALRISDDSPTPQPTPLPTNRPTRRPTPTPTRQPTLAPTGSPSSSIPIGAIVGGAVGAVAAVCITIFGVVYVRAKHAVAAKEASAKPPVNTDDDIEGNPQVSTTATPVSVEKPQTPVANVVPHDSQQHTMAAVVLPVVAGSGPAFKDQVQTVIGQPVPRNSSGSVGLPSARGMFQPSPSMLKSGDGGNERNEF